MLLGGEGVVGGEILGVRKCSVHLFGGQHLTTDSGWRSVTWCNQWLPTSWGCSPTYRML